MSPYYVYVASKEPIKRHWLIASFVCDSLKKNDHDARTARNLTELLITCIRLVIESLQKRRVLRTAEATHCLLHLVTRRNLYTGLLLLIESLHKSRPVLHTGSGTAVSWTKLDLKIMDSHWSLKMKYIQKQKFKYFRLFIYSTSRT